MERCKDITDLGCADIRIHGDGASLDAHQGRHSTIVFDVKIVQLCENRLKFIPLPDVAMVMICASRFRVDFCLEASHNTEIVTSTFHGPVQIAVARCVHAYRRAIRQDDVEMHETIGDHAIEALETPVAATQT